MSDPEIRRVEDKLLCQSIAENMGAIIVGDCEDGYCKKNHDACCLKDSCARHPINGSWKDLPKDVDLGSFWVGSADKKE